MKILKLLVLFIFLGLFACSFNLVSAQIGATSIQKQDTVKLIESRGLNKSDINVFSPIEISLILSFDDAKKAAADLKQELDKLKANAPYANHKLEDYGLTKQGVKDLNLTDKQISEMLNTPTAAEIKAVDLNFLKKSPATGDYRKQLEALFSNFIQETPKEAVDCSLYYKFGSVQTDLSAQDINFKAGDTINIKGNVINQNDFPVVSGNLYVKISRTRDVTDNNGLDIVDQFLAVDDINIPAKGKTPVNFSWKSPTYLQSGEYRVISFFTVDKKYNLLGLSFTDDVVGNFFVFNVKGKNSGVEFDRTSATFNEKQIYFTNWIPKLENSVKDPAVINIKLKNTTSEDQKINITWKIYKWDAVGENDLIRTINDTQTVKANSSIPVEIKVGDNAEPVYYVLGELRYKDSKSIIGIRFARSGNNQLRINFPTVSGFPFKQGKQYSIFSCIYNVGDSSTSGAKMVLKLTDKTGNIIDEYNYNGDVVGMMGLKKDFVAQKDYDDVFLTAQLFKGNKLSDESTIEYDCNKIDPSLCKKTDKIFTYILAGVALLILLISIIFIVLMKRKPQAQTT